MKLLEVVHPRHPLRRRPVGHAVDDEAQVPDAPVAVEAGAHEEERRRRAHRQGRGQRSVESYLEPGSIRLLSAHAANSTRFPWPLFCPGSEQPSRQGCGKDAARAGVRAEMIVFGTAVTDPDTYDRCAAPGIQRAASRIR